MDESLEDKGQPDGSRRVILIAGPTASGKSALALAFAKSLNGVIINADSMQLYEDLRLVSARPSVEEEREAPHRLYGVLSASTAFSTGDWLRMATAEIGSVWQSGKTPILVGGTGLYFKALTEGFAELPSIPDDIRVAARDLADRSGPEGLKRELKRLGDEKACRDLSDPQRLARALEVLMATGEPISDWQKQHHAEPFLNIGQAIRIVLAPPRPWLHDRIEQRAHLMLSEKGIGEVRNLLAKGLSDKLPAMRAIGVNEIGAFLKDETNIDETAYRLTVATRQYAKRQETWFRNQMGDWQRVDPSKEFEITELLDKISG